MRLTFVVLLLATACARDDGAPDPAPRELVPCEADAGPGDPLACPAPAPQPDAPPLP